MPIRFVCPDCEQAYQAPETAAGKRRSCLKCGAVLRVPLPAPPDEAATSDDLTCVLTEREPLKHKKTQNDPGKLCSMLSVIFGAIAILFFPPLFGLSGFVLGVIGVVIGNDKVTPVLGIVISIFGTFLGMTLGILFFK